MENTCLDHTNKKYSRRLTEESSQQERHGHPVYIMQYATCTRYTCPNPLPRKSMLARARGSWRCAIFSFRMTPRRECLLLYNIEHWGEGGQLCERGCCVLTCVLVANFLPSTVRQTEVKVLSYAETKKHVSRK